jgi:hypothetical protein
LGAVTYALVTAPTIGTATLPAADGSFTFTGNFVATGDPVGADSVTFSADDADPAGPTNVTVPITVGAAPVITYDVAGTDLQPDVALKDGRQTFDVFYKTVVTFTSTLTDPTPQTPLAGFAVRWRNGLGAPPKQAVTDANGHAVFKFAPLVTDEYAFNAPTLPGTFFEGLVLWVAPDWKIARKFPVKNKKYVISGRLLAGKSARTRGSFVRFQRKKGSKWITVIAKLPISKTMTFTARVPRAANAGKRVRFLYVSKNDDYIGSSYEFTIAVKKSATARALHR